MFKRKGINIKDGQHWTIGKGTQKLVYENNGVTVSNTVEITQWLGNGGFIEVKCLQTGLTFDVKPQNLGTFIQ